MGAPQASTEPRLSADAAARKYQSARRSHGRGDLISAVRLHRYVHYKSGPTWASNAYGATWLSAGSQSPRKKCSMASGQSGARGRGGEGGFSLCFSVRFPTPAS